MGQQFLMVPYSVLFDDRLNDGDKITLSLIISYSKTDMGCIISNGTLGKILNISPTAASERITKLKKLGYITCKNITIKNYTRRKVKPITPFGLDEDLLQVKLKEVFGLDEGGTRST
jgi:Mn-dependent DtxR family transcriptional regulator